LHLSGGGYLPRNRLFSSSHYFLFLALSPPSFRPLLKRSLGLLPGPFLMDTFFTLWRKTSIWPLSESWNALSPTSSLLLRYRTPGTGPRTYCTSLSVVIIMLGSYGMPERSLLCALFWAYGPFLTIRRVPAPSWVLKTRILSYSTSFPYPWPSFMTASLSLFLMPPSPDSLGRFLPRLPLPQSLPIAYYFPCPTRNRPLTIVVQNIASLVTKESIPDACYSFFFFPISSDRIISPYPYLLPRSPALRGRTFF